MIEKSKETEADIDVTICFLQCPVCESYEVDMVDDNSDKCNKCGLTWAAFSGECK